MVLQLRVLSLINREHYWYFIRIKLTIIKLLLCELFQVSCSLDKTVKIWDLQGKCLKTLAEHQRYVSNFDSKFKISYYSPCDE